MLRIVVALWKTVTICVLFLITLGIVGCSTTARISVTTSSRTGCIEACPPAAIFTVTGTGFVQGQTVVVDIPFVPAVGDIPLKTVQADSNGGFAFTTEVICKPTAHPDANLAHTIYVNASVDGTAEAAAQVPASTAVCTPPFDFGADNLCAGQTPCPATLSLDSPTAIGLHWPDLANEDFEHFRYGLIGDQAHWHQSQDFGSDVHDVEVNNIQPRLGYGFELQECQSNTLAPASCGSWLDLGDAATV